MPPYSVHAEPWSAWSDDLEMLSGRYLIAHLHQNSLSALDLIFADFPHRIKKIEIEALRVLGWTESVAEGGDPVLGGVRGGGAPPPRFPCF